MDLRINPGPLQGTVEAVPSKSEAHRLLILAALAGTPTEIGLPQSSGDIESTISCLQAMGAGIKRAGGSVVVRPLSKMHPSPLLHCGESGSTLRFLLPVAAAVCGGGRFCGGGRLPERPLGELVAAMKKRGVCRKLAAVAGKYGFTYIGGHPMAGKEKWGFANSTDSLFNGAFMILTPDESAGMPLLEKLKRFFTAIGFAGLTITSPEEHDRIIAYTSQLAHITSGAYVKSPEAQRHCGLSAGSFRDLTRVARLDPVSYTHLDVYKRQYQVVKYNYHRLIIIRGFIKLGYQ